MTRRSYQRKADQPTAITPIEYSGLQEAFDHFSSALFEGTLPDCFITYQRKAHSFGYFSPDRFSGRVGKFGKHELALNPDGFINQTDQQVCQTLVHEMTHLWQHAAGKPAARGYHNKEWAAKMKAIGLQPSSTGMVGGKETGQRMLDYIIPNGPFTKAFAKLAAKDWKLNLQSAHRPGAKGGNDSKTPFICTSCGLKAWGKPSLQVTCTSCLLQHPALEIFSNQQIAAVVDAIKSATLVNERTIEPIAVAPDIPAPSPSYQILPTEAEPPKRKPGRPKGSKNKPKTRKRRTTVPAMPHGGESECAKASSNL